MASGHDNDLPLMANSCNIHLYHYMLDLQCDFEKQAFSGSIYLFLNPARKQDDKKHVFSSQEYHRLLLEMCTTTGNTDVTHEKKVTESPVSSTSEHRNMGCENKDSGVNNSPHMEEIESENSDTCSTMIGKATENSMEGVTCKRRKLTLTQSGKDVPSGSWQEGDPLLILDSCDLEVMSVHEIDIPEKDLIKMVKDHLSVDKDTQPMGRESYKIIEGAPIKPLNHQVEKWCIKIWKDGVKEYQDFPCIVQVHYSTKPTGSSLRWTKDQDKNPCVFTAAMWVNNRAFFPTAEYGNLSTWQSRITTQGGATVLMSADGPGTQEVISAETGSVPVTHWYHRCSSPLPPHTLAIAVGLWHHQVLAVDNGVQQDASCPVSTCSHQPSCSVGYSTRCVLPCRVYGAPSVVPRAVRILRPYWPSCSRATQELLGACPFPNIDLLIYPPCVQDMALANPGLIFLSQSLLAEDGSMNVRIGHELSHSWFGLLIGARDWTEEWLSEGFATFVEDAIHAATLRMCEKEEIDRGELRALIRFKVLTQEMETTQEDLQTLRPDPTNEEGKGDSAVMYVKNGLNPNKQFTQVHYLKGYFLLRHLSTIVGMRKFNTALKTYIETFHGQLVRSQDFLNHVFRTFPELRERGLTVEKIYSDWLDVPGMPKVLQGFQPGRDNRLYTQVLNEVAKWGQVITSTKKIKKKHHQTQRSSQDPTFVTLESDQLVLLLEELLSSPHTLRADTLRLLKQTYNLQAQNADVRHRWCELVIKHGYRPGYDDVRTFLCHDQAMGVYLYGELVLSGCAVRRALAEQCFELVNAEMEEGTRTTVRTMLYGEAPS